MGILLNAVTTIARSLGLTDTRLVSFVGAGPTYAGETVSYAAALQLDTVYACTRLIAETIATLPLHTYKVGADGLGTIDRDHELYELLHDQPNSEMTAVTFWEAVIACMLLWGNAYIHISRSGRRVVALYPLQPDRITAQRLADKSIEYRYSFEGVVTIISEDDMMHVKGFGTDGILGLSIVGQARESLGIAMAAEKSAASFFRNAMRPSMVLHYDKWLNPDQRKRFEEETREKVTGVINAGGIPLIEGGMKASAISINPDDAELLSTRNFSVEQVCRWFGVQAVMIGHMDKSTSWGSGMEQMNLWFLQYCLRPKLKAIEQAVRKSLLRPGEKKLYYVEFNVDALMRADSAGRAALMTAMVDHGIRTRNEVRSFDNLKPLPGGDDLTVQSNLIPIELLGKAAQKAIDAPPPGFGPDGQPLPPANEPPSGDIPPSPGDKPPPAA